MRHLLSAFLLSALPAAGLAQDAPFEPLPTVFPPDGLAISVDVGAATIMGGSTEPRVLPFAAICVDGPLGVERDGVARLRLGVETAFAGATGETVSPTSVETFRAVIVDMDARFQVGRSLIRGDQVITRAVGLGGGFETRLPDDPDPRDRVARHIEAFLSVRARGQAGEIGRLDLGYGYSEEGGDPAMSMRVKGRVRLTSTFTLGGLAVLPVSAAPGNWISGTTARPEVRVWVAVNMRGLFGIGRRP